MKIQIDAYDETVLVTLTQQVTARSISVLQAGLKKYVKPQTTAIYVIFTACELEQAAEAALQEIKTLQKSEAKSPPAKPSDPPSSPSADQRLVFIGNKPNFCDFPSLTAALLQSKTLESKQILEMLQLQRELELLTARKQVLSEALAAQENESKSKISLFQMNVLLKRTVNVLSSEVKRRATRVLQLKKRAVPERKDNPEAPQEVESRWEALLASLKKQKLMDP